MEAMNSNRAVYVNIMNRAIGLFGSFGLIFVIILTLDIDMQGFYYTFYSLIFLKFFSELGLNFAVVQIISHLKSSPNTIKNLNAYTKFFVKWFAYASILLLGILLPIILVFENQYHVIENYQQRIIMPWIVLSFATSIGVFLNGLISIIEGHRQIVGVSKIRLIQSLGNICTVAGGLFLGFELWSLAMGGVVSAILTCWGISKFSLYFKMPAEIDCVTVDWRREIWPFQWRLAISWISGFFIFYCLTPIVLKFDGPEAAGKLGMSLQMIQAVNSIAIIFVSTHSAIFGSLIAQQKYTQMGSEFLKSAAKSSIFLVILLGGFWIGKTILNIFSDDILLHRLVSNNELLLLTLASLSNHAFFVMNYFFRSFKDESLWFLSLLNSIFIIGLALIFIPIYGASVATMIYAANSLLFWMVIGPPYFLKRRNILLSRD